MTVVMWSDLLPLYNLEFSLDLPLPFISHASYSSPRAVCIFILSWSFPPPISQLGLYHSSIMMLHIGSTSLKSALCLLLYFSLIYCETTNYYDLIHYLIICIFSLIFYGLIPFFWYDYPYWTYGGDWSCDLPLLPLCNPGSSQDIPLSVITYVSLNLCQ